MSTTPMTLIEEYFANNFFPIPMRAGEKRPAVRWKHLVDLQPPFPRDFQPWWLQGNYGVGILLKPSQLLVVDCDSTEAVNEFIHLVRDEPAPCRNMVVTTHGAHFYYSRPADCPPLRRVQLGASKKIDVLSDGYVIAPPTVHPSGLRYEWLARGPLQAAPRWAVERLTEIRVRSIAHAGLSPEDVETAFPNTEEDMRRLGKALSAVNPHLYAILQGVKKVEDRSRTLWLLINTLIRLKLRSERPGAPPERLSDESICKVVWFGALSEKPRERGWQWLCDDIARARLELQPD